MTHSSNCESAGRSVRYISTGPRQHSNSCFAVLGEPWSYSSLFTPWFCCTKLYTYINSSSMHSSRRWRRTQGVPPKRRKHTHNHTVQKPNRRIRHKIQPEPIITAAKWVAFGIVSEMSFLSEHNTIWLKLFSHFIMKYEASVSYACLICQCSFCLVSIITITALCAIMFQLLESLTLLTHPLHQHAANVQPLKSCSKKPHNFPAKYFFSFSSIKD